MIEPVDALEPAAASKASNLSPSVKDDYWANVEDCLVEFLKKSRDEASSGWRDERRRLELIEEEHNYPDLIYHVEPFYVACDIAGLSEIPDQEALLKIHRDEYHSILDARDW